MTHSPVTVAAAVHKGKTDGPAVPRRKSNLVVLGGSMVIDGGEGSVIQTLFPVIQAALGLATSALGILAASARLVGAIAGPLWVYLARKLGRKPILAIATGFWGAWGIAAGFAQDFVQLVILYTVMAAGTAAAHAIVPTVIADSFEDRKRGRVVGVLYGGTAAAASLLAPLIGQLANIEDGWRYGFFAFGAINMLFGLLIVIFYKDPGEGASEAQLGSFTQAERDAAEKKITWSKVVGLLRIPSYVILLGSRLLSSHLLLAAFGVVLLVQEYGFDTALAATVMAPFGLGYLAGTFVGGITADWANKLSVNYGRVAFLQFAQVLFAVIAFFATQFDYGSIVPFLALFALVGLAQGLNPGVNRPLVMSVVPPELRGAAFAIFVSVIESIGFAIYTLVGGFLADAIGLKAVMFWLVVVIMLVNALFLTFLYRPYKHDRLKLQAELDDRRDAILAAERAENG
ncbi:MFS transporter [Microbacterium aquimaris]|uniref:MFS transporter n=1 Tax=Microbacterium aquimaris TaxID=459816 RepID=A0ABU5N2E7_9MICO|nr:MFS transporter [Microbacterium aquimaris]MDZ8160250.1 MFS transporter [Microbacterium aquimaris]